MKNAMISPNELVYDYYTSQLLGWRVAQVEPDGQTFPVADPCFWVVCADDVVADQFYYDPNNKVILLKPPPPPPDYNAMRYAAYVAESDPIFFMSQRGEATQQQWLDKIAEIKARWPA